MTLFKSLCLIITLIQCSDSLAQHQVGFKLAGSASKIVYDFNDIDGEYSSSFCRTFETGFYYNYHFKNSLIGAELDYFLIKGKEMYRGINSLDSNFTRISYVAVPIYYGIKIKKITIYAGAVIAFNLYSEQASKGHYHASYPGGGPSDDFNWNHGYNHIKLDLLDYGLRTGIVYNVNRWLGIEGSYYYGLNSIYLNTTSGVSSWRNQQISLGVRFTFFQKDTSESE